MRIKCSRKFLESRWRKAFAPVRIFIFVLVTKYSLKWYEDNYKGIVIKGEMRKSYFKNIYIVILLCLTVLSKLLSNFVKLKLNASNNLFQVNDFEEKKILLYD